MDLTLIKETLENKAAGYIRMGFSLADAVHNAACELLAGAGGRLDPSGMFCLRACLAGAEREMSRPKGRPEFN